MCHNTCLPLWFGLTITFTNHYIFISNFIKKHIYLFLSKKKGHKKNENISTWCPFDNLFPRPPCNCTAYQIMFFSNDINAPAPLTKSPYSVFSIITILPLSVIHCFYLTLKMISLDRIQIISSSNVFLQKYLNFDSSIT